MKKKTERKSRKLVAENKKIHASRKASSLFADSGNKYDVNKMRAQSLASLTNTGITYCAAKDHPTLDALRARTDLPTKQI